MATLTATRAASTFPVYSGTHGNLRVAYGSYDLAANPTAADVLEICRLPAGAVALGGWLRAEDIDSNATETIEMDVGWLANGTDSADADGFLNSGALNGDAVTNYLPEGGVLIPLHGTLGNGPVTFAAETVVTVTFVANAATFAAGTITVVVFYVIP